jgi:FkbM family methyltransferase
MKKNSFLNFSLKNKKFYKIYLYYNLYIRNFKYLLKKSYSQVDEDTFLVKYFSKKKGFYIDIGCHHPFRDNNTFLLYKLGWSGLNIDLNRISIDLFNIMRPRDTNICSAISNKNGIIKYFVPDKNPISSEITISKEFSKDLNKRHGNNYKSFKTKSVTWKNIESKYKSKLKFVDLLKIDIEGLDYQILKSISLESLKPHLIMIEAPHFEKLNRQIIINYLTKKKYKIIYDNTLNIIFKRRIKIISKD